MIEPIRQFELERATNIANLGQDNELKSLSIHWLRETLKHKYSYNFTSLGRPIIQYPQDMVAIQELIWQIKPDLVIETGIAHGGSLILSASMLAMLDYCDALESNSAFDPRNTKRRVLGIDIDIREHNRAAIENHPMSHLIDMIQGSSIEPDIIQQVSDKASKYQKVLVILDSNHTHDHVLAELEAYAPLVSKDSYCVVFDSVIEDLPDSAYPDRPWGKGNNPKTAVLAYLQTLENEQHHAADKERLMFHIDSDIQNKLLITVAPEGYLKRA
jgi:cephalosporin hydroxylase